MPLAALAVFSGWLLFLLVAWALAWLLYASLTGQRIPVEVSGLAATLWWTGAKVLVWLVPVFVLVRRVERARTLEWLGLKDVRGLGWGALAAAAWIAALGAQALWTHHVPSTGGITAGTVSACVVAPVFEETVFRGFALRHLRGRGLGFWRANALAALAFTALHVPGWIFMRGADAALLVDCGTVAFFGLVLGAVAWRVPSLWGPILVHAANNAWSAGIVAWLAQRLAG